MSDKNLNEFQKIASDIEEEEIGYYLLDYGASIWDMPDEKSKELFANAEKALREFKTYIFENAQ